MKEIIKYNLLLDLYGPLLTKKQMKYLSLYFFEDYSFNEIAQKHKVTKSAVYDSISKSKKQLLSFENKINLLKKQNERIKIYEKIEDLDIKKELFFWEKGNLLK